MNYVELEGNLTRKPELRYGQSGTAVCKFGLAVNEEWEKDGERKKRTTFVDCTAFGKMAEDFAAHSDKGTRAHIEGSLRLDQWEDKNTWAKRSKLYVVVSFFHPPQRTIHEQAQQGDDTPF